MSSREGFVLSLMALGLLMVGSPWLLDYSANELAAISACGIGTLLMVPAMAALLGRQGNVGIGLAVPSNTARRLMEAIVRRAPAAGLSL